MSIRSCLHLGMPLVFALITYPGHSEAPVTSAPLPMLAPWTGPYGGVPPWDKVVPKDFLPAFEAAMAEQRRNIQAIAGNSEAPTFENTLAAMERSGRALERVNVLAGVHFSTLKLGDVGKIEAEIMPRLAAFSDEIVQNGPLFQRIEAVYLGADKASLDPVQKRLAWLYYTNFVRAGAKLNSGQKTRIKAINQRLAVLSTLFSQNVLAEEDGQFTVIEKEADLAGLPADFRASAARAAEAKGLKGRWVIANTRSSMEPFLSYAENRQLREKVWRTYVNRGDNGGKTDNKATITEILKLRFERAQLLGYATHAHWALERSMARTPERAVALMEAMWKPAAAQVRADVAEMQAIIDKEGGTFKLAPWDYRFYAEKLRKAKYDLDFNEVQPYMQLDKLREGMFWAAGQLYGLSFTLVKGLPLQHPDVSVFEVKNARASTSPSGTSTPSPGPGSSPAPG